MPVGVARCSSRAAVLETSLLTVLKSSLPKLPCQLGYCWLQELVPVQRGCPQSCVEDEAGWQLRLPGCIGCSKGELSPRPGLGGSTSMVRTVQVSHTHSPFSSLGAQLPVSGQLMWWECILQAAGLRFVMTQRAGESRGGLLPTMPLSVWEKWEQRHSGAGVPAGSDGEMYPSLSPSTVVGRGEHLVLAIEAVAAHPRPGQSLHLHQGWALLQRLPPHCCREVQQNENLNSYRIY